MEDIKNSYTAANALPVKIFKDKKLLDSLEAGIIPPVHVQISPTNACNLNCSFCSCDDRDKKQQLSLDALLRLVDDMSDLGTRGVTITGGGEPTIYKHINTFIKALNDKDIRSGLVSNGIPLKNVNEYSMSALTWARISFGNDRVFNSRFKEAMDYMSKFKTLDKAFSYVLSGKPNFDNIVNIVDYANKHEFTHVRMVDDIYAPTDGMMESVKKKLQSEGIDDGKVIYQGRKDFSKGLKDCFISLLKPVVAPDGFVYPCCGVQYAINGQAKTFPEIMRMGRVEDFKSIYSKQSHFNGSVCNKCYYGDYNVVLKALKSDIKHLEFI